MASAARITGIFILFFITFLIGLIPFALLRIFEKKENIKKWIGILNCFAGGVFLATAILHLLPESRELLTESISFEYPVTEAIAGCGFLLTLTLEHLVSYYGFGNFHMHDHGHDNKIEPNDAKDLEMAGSNKTEDTDKKGNADKSTEEVIIEQPNLKFLVFRSFLALSFHMIFEGWPLACKKRRRTLGFCLEFSLFTKSLLLSAWASN